MTSKERAKLRSLASAEPAVVQVGKAGINDSVIRSAAEALEARELVKMSVLDNSGLTSREAAEEIAEKLHISPHTVKRHIENMLVKTGYKNRIDLAVNAKAFGVVVHEDDRTENRAPRG